MLEAFNWTVNLLFFWWPGSLKELDAHEVLNFENGSLI